MRRRGKPGFASFLFSTLIFLHMLPPGQTDAQVANRHARTSVALSPSSHYAAAVLMEPKTGQILYEQEMHKPWPAASLTKMMVMLLVMEKISDKSLAATDAVEVSARASMMGGSQVYLEPGEVFTVEEMMKAIVIHSANDAAEAVAEHIAGSAEAFVELMNRRAKELGLRETEYHNVHGLPPARGQSPTLTSAHDTAVLARELVRYPDILKWASTVKDEFRGGKFILENTNRLIGRFPGADGLKTGYYYEAGFNVAATAQRDGTRFIAVILGSPSGRLRFREAARLLTRGFDNFKVVTVMRAGEAVANELRIKGGEIDVLHPVAESPARVVVPRSEENQVKTSVQLNGPVWAPLKKGDKLGELIVTLGGRSVEKFTLVSNRDIEASNIFKRFWDTLF